MTKKILGVTIMPRSKSDILEKIKKNMAHRSEFFNVVSLNTENLVVANENEQYREVLNTAQIQLVDGVGIVVATRILGIHGIERYAGVDLMSDLLIEANNSRSTVMLIGGEPKVAESVVECQKDQFPTVNFKALQGIADISHPESSEEEKIFSIVALARPQLLFVAFGSPAQELWINKNRHKFTGVTCMGVGGAFDFLAHRVPRAPKIIRRLGFEWLFRLLLQPWRIKRQLRIIKFFFLIFKERFSTS